MNSATKLLAAQTWQTLLTSKNLDKQQQKFFRARKEAPLWFGQTALMFFLAQKIRKPFGRNYDAKCRYLNTSSASHIRAINFEMNLSVALRLTSNPATLVLLSFFSISLLRSYRKCVPFELIYFLFFLAFNLDSEYIPFLPKCDLTGIVCVVMKLID